MAEEFRFDPDTYRQLMSDEVPSYERLQDEVTAATVGTDVHRMLDLGAGMGDTSARVLTRHPSACVVALDENEKMLDGARAVLSGAELVVGRLEDPLPAGPFDLVVSALAIHHLDGPGKAELFTRVAATLRPGGRFVLGDLIVPEDPDDVVTPVDGVHDTPSRLDEQLDWLRDAGLTPTVAWHYRDLAVVAADRRAG